MAAATSAQSLGGLHSENARSFVRRIQPLIANRCAAAGCHGPGTASDFRFSSIRNGSTPLTAERNLAAVLGQVEPADPQQSPLLQKADQLHGGMREPAFRGRVGAQQRQMLHDWVRAAVADLHPEFGPAPEPAELQPSLAAADTLPPRRVTQQSAAGSSHAADTALVELTEQTHGRPVERASADKKMLEHAARAVATDPFSPSSFNRRFHQVRAQTPDLQDSPDEPIVLPP